ncbi:curli production assembly/transport component CsgF [Hymenobacter daecheongensis DSM 21074]|uniref:Curli production assembly/transport component CsgF n=1 Tax=Hymenobacter daecheongensis DSM 21074 TaxID=1121955 RepID=A0A1M6F2D3_9BACT|nr:curli production assembly/transport component CsgF [Hymenobacter daecheongensis]SHI91779.1 curli production assembly/transport component CsgF [Hymenobacter daecheongensis DSM 21074]
MKSTLLRWGLLLLLLAFSGPAAWAQDFVYEPKNPSFGGGNTFNYSWLLSAAQAQNTIEDPASKTNSNPFSIDPLKQFEQSLNQQILGQLAQKLVGNQFGSQNKGLQEGSYTVGSYQINVVPTGGGFSVQITDTNTGNQTTVTIPYF